jgi:zinc transport system ATP-binding protein
MIEIRHLNFSYTDQPPWLLEDINLSIGKGDYLSVVGDNGSGKSTFIKLVLGFLEPSAGTLRRGSERVGYVPQRRDESNTGFPITLNEMLCAYKRLYRATRSCAVGDVLDKVGLTPYASQLVGTLSGGQMQKALIARALLVEPELLVLDEPSTGIDSASQTDIYTLIYNLNREQKMTILSVEHNLEAAVKNSSMIYHLYDGSGHLCSPSQFIDEFFGK